MIHPKYWVKHAIAHRALSGYPLYDVPHKTAERTLTEEQVQENFAHFMHTRHDRLTFLQNWLLKKFRVRAPLDGDGLVAVDKWISDYGGGVIGDEYDPFIFGSYAPLWKDKYAGYSVMVDVAIFISEYLISKRKNLHWGIYRGHEIEPATFASSSYLRPVILGLPRGWVDDVFQLASGSIADSHKTSKIGDHRVYADPNGLIYSCKTTLHLANAPDDGEQYIFGDYSNEPI